MSSNELVIAQGLELDIVKETKNELVNTTDNNLITSEFFQSHVERTIQNVKNENLKFKFSVDTLIGGYGRQDMLNLLAYLKVDNQYDKQHEDRKYNPHELSSLFSNLKILNANGLFDRTSDGSEIVNRIALYHITKDDKDFVDNIYKLDGKFIDTRNMSFDPEVGLSMTYKLFIFIDYITEEHYVSVEETLKTTFASAIEKGKLIISSYSKATKLDPEFNKEDVAELPLRQEFGNTIASDLLENFEAYVKHKLGDKKYLLVTDFLSPDVHIIGTLDFLWLSHLFNIPLLMNAETKESLQLIYSDFYKNLWSYYTTINLKECLKVLLDIPRFVRYNRDFDTILYLSNIRIVMQVAGQDYFIDREGLDKVSYTDQSEWLNECYLNNEIVVKHLTDSQGNIYETSSVSDIVADVVIFSSEISEDCIERKDVKLKLSDIDYITEFSDYNMEDLLYLIDLDDTLENREVVQGMLNVDRNKLILPIIAKRYNLSVPDAYKERFDLNEELFNSSLPVDALKLTNDVKDFMSIRGLIANGTINKEGYNNQIISSHYSRSESLCL